MDPFIELLNDKITALEKTTTQMRDDVNAHSRNIKDVIEIIDMLRAMHKETSDQVIRLANGLTNLTDAVTTLSQITARLAMPTNP